MNRKLPKWCKECRKALIDKDMSVTEFAIKLGVSREHLSSVLSGKYISPKFQKEICETLGVKCEKSA